MRLRRLTAEGKTLLLTTHFMEEAERLCHRLAIMDRGRIIVQGTPRALIAEHIEPQVVEVHGPGSEAWMASARAHGHAEQVFDIATVTMFCLAMRRQTYQHLGLLDERYEVGLLLREDGEREVAAGEHLQGLRNAPHPRRLMPRTLERVLQIRPVAAFGFQIRLFLPRRRMAAARGGEIRDKPDDRARFAGVHLSQ